MCNGIKVIGIEGGFWCKFVYCSDVVIIYCCSDVKQCFQCLRVFWFEISWDVCIVDVGIGRCYVEWIDFIFNYYFQLVNILVFVNVCYMEFDGDYVFGIVIGEVDIIVLIRIVVCYVIVIIRVKFV